MNLQKKSIAVVGAGNLGSALAHRLGQAGVRHVLLVDPDIAEPHNLETSNYLRKAVEFSQIGKIKQTFFKACALQTLGRHLFPRTQWHSECREVADTPLQKLAACDLIFSATYSTLARAETSLLARMLHKPVIDGGLKGGATREGRVAYFAPQREAACYLCGIGDQRRSELLRWALAAQLGCAPEPPSPAMDNAATLAETVAARMMEVAQEPPLQGSRAWIIADDSPQDQQIDLPLSSDCPWHDLAAWGSPVFLNTRMPIRAELQRIRTLRNENRLYLLQLLWPICLEAQCRACGARIATAERVAHVRRHGICHACGIPGQLEPTRCIERIAENDSAADRSLDEFQFPEDHLFWCRAQYHAATECEMDR